MLRTPFAMLLALLTTGLLLAADDKADAAKELKRFEGVWIMIAGEKDGEKLSDEHVKKSKITWKGEEVTVETPHQAKEPIKAKMFKLNPAKKPGEMDWTRANGPDAGKPMLAIYEFIGDDQYRVIFAPAGKDRPKEFSTKAGGGLMMHTWKKAK